METVTNDDRLEEYKDNIKLIEEEDDDNIEEIEEVNDDVDNIDVKTDKVIKSNSQYASKTVKDLRKIIADNYEYADMFKHSMKKSHTKARKESLISFLDNLDNVKVSYSAVKSLKKERLEAYENNKVNNLLELRSTEKEEKEKEIEKKEIEKEMIDSCNIEKQNEIYKNTQDDLNKLKNNKKINDNVNPYAEVKQELLEGEEEEENDEDMEEEKREIENAKYQIGLYFERFTWLKSQTFTSTIANPKELLKEIEMKVGSRNMSSLFKSQFFVTLSNLEDLNEKYGGGWIKAKGFSEILSRNEAARDTLDELLIKYSSKFSSICSPEMRLGLILASTLYAVDSFNRDAEERDNLKQKKINEDHINKYSDL